MPSFGAIKVLQQRTGADRATCKKALADHGDDEDAAASWIASNTEFADSKAAPPTAEVQAEEEAQTGGFADVSVVRIEVGDGTTYAEYGDTLHVHYRGMLADDGTEFDSSYGRNQEFTFRFGMGKVIKGWDIGFAKMSLGEKALLFVPSSMAYGAQGNGTAVPPNSDLKFEVHLLNITRQTSCLGPGQHGGVQRKNHEYAQLADQLLGRAPPQNVEHRVPDERQPMPLTADMPR
eukprot:CAMPEP_0174694866 /NCGR_PEP_ID=MMETSP1094-20130205/1356_1 /TAXON_ID=156173 /ORGANISM="Chrysochromulina brevifilum, Strain UTEX LB 985" /LENGTH=233 /DNA_ID=CAMNT_0015891215 /DNA_START=57 /DNA_END=758 /DNA_ORIENTATION=+